MNTKYITESVTRDLMYLYKYLKTDDYSDITFAEPWYIEEYFNDFYVQIDNQEFNQYMKDMEWSDAVYWLYTNDRYKFDELTKWIVDYKHDEGQRGYTKLYFDGNPKLLKNHWLLHFTDHAYDVFKDGFDFGTYDMHELGLTTYKRSEKGGTFAFAYDAETTGLRTYGASGFRDFKYGQQVVMFRASGVKVYHNSDDEYQVIFDTRTVHDLIVIEKTSYNDTDVWAVTDRKGRPLYKTQTDDRDQLENAVNWVIKNYDRYHKSIDTGKAPSIKEPNKFKKQFESFLDNLKTDGNTILIESVKQGYHTIFESNDVVVKVNNYVYHKSPPVFRESILNNGIKASIGEQRYGEYTDDNTPRVFATNSDDENDWFDSTYDDDVWKINTNLIKDAEWYRDANFNNNHVYTLSDIPANAIELVYKGTGDAY